MCAVCVREGSLGRLLESMFSTQHNNANNANNAQIITITQLQYHTHSNRSPPQRFIEIHRDNTHPISILLHRTEHVLFGVHLNNHSQTPI